jgi:undecaprenyl-diphosphatase
VLAIVACTWIFIAIAEDVVTSDPLVAFDVRVSEWLQYHRNDWLTWVMLLITDLHSTVGVILMSVLASAYWWKRRLRYWVSTAAMTIGGGMLLNLLLKNVFQRSRPHLPDSILTLTSYGFPSGHTMAATVLWGTLCAFAVSQLRNWGMRVLASLAAAAMIALIAFSRVYLGAHYLTDVLGAIAEGLAWLGFCFTAMEVLRRRRRLKK